MDAVEREATGARLSEREPDEGGLELSFEGRLDSAGTGPIWMESMRVLAKRAPERLVVEASGVHYCDVSGIALFRELRRAQADRGGTFELAGLREDFRKLFDQFETRPRPSAPEPLREGGVEHLGRAFLSLLKDAHVLVSFVGELCLALVYAVTHPRHIRRKDVWVTAESAGVDALPIVALVSFLIGMIMAFESAIPMKDFGVEIFVANLVAISMLRELGPLMTAIVLAGRSGSAFAAEIGTMKVNEEVDALKTMGLDPVRFLVTSRVIAAVVMTPLLTLFANLMGLVGGFVVFYSFGFPFVTYVHQVQTAVDVVDLLAGLTKAFAFGVLVAAIGCLRGLQTGSGASAVGQSTTRAVVSGIVLICLADAVFSVVFYALDI